jgi:hypothetical protein
VKGGIIMKRGLFLVLISTVLLFPALVQAKAGGQGKAQGNSCMSQCMVMEADYFDDSHALTQFCRQQCNVGTGQGACLTSADGCCVPYTGDPDCEIVARYNGLANGDDEAIAIAADPMTGNVYVTGWSIGGDTSSDYATVAYDSNLNELWVARYDGPVNDYDLAQAIALDSVTGNVYVTGYSVGSTSTSYDYATVAYDSSGTELWVRRYNGPANGYDSARAIAADSVTGNVYVTGRSYGVATNSDYATVAYDSSGTELWVRRYDGPVNGDDVAFAIAADPATGNVYVTGGSDDVSVRNYYATVAYDSSGSELWVRRYIGPKNFIDVATAIAADPATGNVYVTGRSYGVATNSDYATVAYDSSGSELWVRRYDEAKSWDDAEAVAVDPETGNVYVTGGSLGVDTDWDYATVAYDSSGNELWVGRYDEANGYDFAEAIAADPVTGNVYVTGHSRGGAIYPDYATVAYDSDGNELWVERYNGPENYHDEAYAIAADPATGNVYVTGSSTGVDTNTDYATVKY